jgi:hypothetical protein
VTGPTVPLSTTPVTVTRRRTTIVTVGVTLAFLFAFTAILYAISSNRDHNQDVCREVERIKTYIRDTIRPTDIGAPGTPGYAYYQAHPDELLLARREAFATQRRFGPESCPR